MSGIIKIQHILLLDLFDKELSTFSQKSLFNDVQSVTIMDTSSIANWINENELLIIGDYFKDQTAVNIRFLQELSQKNCSGIITKKKFKGFISKELQNYCLNNNLPILYAENDLSWSQLMQPITELITSNNWRILRNNRHFRSKLIHILSSYDFTIKFADTLTPVINHAISFTNSSLQLLDGSSSFEWGNVLPKIRNHIPTGDMELVGKNIEGHPYFAYVYTNEDTFDNFIVYIFPIENQLKIIGYFLIVFDETDEHYSLTKEWTNDYLNIEIITNIEAIMETYKIQRRMSNESKILNISNNNMMFQRLVNEKNVDTVEQEILLNYLNLSPSCTYISCQIYFKELNNILLSNKKYNFIQDLSDYLIDKTILTNESLHIYFHQKNLIILFEEELFDRSVLDLIITYIKKNYLKGKISIGVSSALPLNKIHSSCTQSFLALSYTKFFDYHRIEMYDHLGFLGIFIDDDGNFNDSQYSTLFERYIKPLKNYDQQNNTSLLKTAISYFTNDMKKKQTSDNLFIHVNTLNARLERIEEVLNIDLVSSKDIVLFGLSLNLYMTLENLLN